MEKQGKTILSSENTQSPNSVSRRAAKFGMKLKPVNNTQRGK